MSATAASPTAAPAVPGLVRRSIVLPLVTDAGTVLRDVRTSFVEQGEGDPVILLHGGCVGGSAAHTWSSTIAGLCRRYRLIAPDLLWSGYTDKPAVPVTLPLQAAHVRAFVAALGLRRIRIVGQSVGAYLAARHACDHEDEVTHLAMIGSNTVAHALGVVFATSSPTPAADERAHQRQALARLFHRQELVTEALIEARAAIGALAGVAEARASFAAYSRDLLERRPEAYAPFELRARLPQLRIPTLLVWGVEDRFAPVSIGRDVASLLPRTPYIEVDGGGHAVYLDQPAAVNALLERFFDGSLALDDLPPGSRSGTRSAAERHLPS